MIDAAFFGCWGEAGHFLWIKEKRYLSDHECLENLLPRGHYLDGSDLLLPKPEVKGEGACTYLPVWNLTVLSWWNSVWDSRPGVNSHIMFRGNRSPELMWAVFESSFLDIWKRHTKPVIKVRY